MGIRRRGNTRANGGAERVSLSTREGLARLVAVLDFTGAVVLPALAGARSRQRLASILLTAMRWKSPSVVIVTARRHADEIARACSVLDAGRNT